MSEYEIEVGKLISSVEHLTSAVETLTVKVETMEAKLNTGKGFIFGLVLSAGALGGSLGALSAKALKSIIG